MMDPPIHDDPRDQDGEAGEAHRQDLRARVLRRLRLADPAADPLIAQQRHGNRTMVGSMSRLMPTASPVSALRHTDGAFARQTTA